MVGADWKLHVRFKMRMEIHFTASHEHANSEQGCTTDLKHVLLTMPMMLRMRMLLILLPEVTCRRCPRAAWAVRKLLVNQPGVGGGGLDNYEVSCNCKFQPPNTPAKAC